MARKAAIFSLGICLLIIVPSLAWATPFTLISERYTASGYISPGFTDDVSLPDQDSTDPVSINYDYGFGDNLQVFATGKISDSQIKLESGIGDFNFIGEGQSQIAFQVNADTLVDVTLLGERTGGDCDWMLSLFDDTLGESMLYHEPGMGSESESEYYPRSHQLKLFEDHVYSLDITAIGYHLDLSNIQISMDFGSVPVPEPSSLFLMGAGLLFLGYRRSSATSN